MTAILYPVAETAEAALAQPKGFAVREREASRIAGSPVKFVTFAVGPTFSTKDAARDAYAETINDDPAGPASLPSQRIWLQLRPVNANSTKPPCKPSSPAKPAYRDGRRWPVPQLETRQAVAWKWSVSFWRIDTAAADFPETAARKVRRDGAGQDLDGPALDALSRQPLRPTRPQQPLDIGLFEVQVPESPDTVMPDD